MRVMTYQSMPRTVALAMLVLAAAGAWAYAQESTPVPAPAPAPAKADSKAAKGTAAAQAVPAAGQGLGAFGKVLPLGEKNLDVKIPAFKDGVPSSTVRADTMVRLDDENMELEGMVIRLYGQTHDEDVNIRLVTALYHMPSQILSSNKRSRVSRSDFDLQGDSMVFDTRTGQGKMTGNVRMVIYDSESLTSPAKSESPAKGETPASTDQPDAAPPAAQPTPPSSPPPNEKK
jgi:hypothetical protein